MSRGEEPLGWPPVLIDFYRALNRRQYERLLENMSIRAAGATLLDAGCGSGLRSLMFHELGFRVTAVDIADAALKKLRRAGDDIRIVCSTLADFTVPDNAFDIVHCADVLYHILDDGEWRRSLENLTRIAKRYVIIKGGVADTRPFMTAPHVRFRPHALLVSTMKTLGFVRAGSVPVKVALRSWNYPLLVRLPRLTIRLERLLIDNRHMSGSDVLEAFIKAPSAAESVNGAG